MESKSESKDSRLSQESKSNSSQNNSEAKHTTQIPTITITSVDCQPEDDCLVTDGIELDVGFMVDEGLVDAYWKITVSLVQMETPSMISKEEDFFFLLLWIKLFPMIKRYFILGGDTKSEFSWRTMRKLLYSAR